MISEFIAGMLGTMAFSILFGVPSRYYVYCGLIGSGGWIIYSAAVKVLGPGINTASESSSVLPSVS